MRKTVIKKVGKFPAHERKERKKQTKKQTHKDTKKHKHQSTVI